MPWCLGGRGEKVQSDGRDTRGEAIGAQGYLRACFVSLCPTGCSSVLMRLLPLSSSASSPLPGVWVQVPSSDQIPFTMSYASTEPANAQLVVQVTPIGSNAPYKKPPSLIYIYCNILTRIHHSTGSRACPQPCTCSQSAPPSSPSCPAPPCSNPATCPTARRGQSSRTPQKS